MRAPRNLSLLAALLVLLLALAACGNDPEEGGEDAATEGGGDTATEEAADDGTEATDEATEAAGGAESDALVDLETVCQEDYADVEVPEGFSVGLVTDIGSVDDGTFNQYAYDGMVAAEECFGITTDFIETSSEADYQRNLETILESDPDVVITVGFLLGDATLQFAEANPDVNFIGVDQFQEEYPDNYVGVLFREDQGGFLAGAMAGLLTESGTVGVIGGLESVPAVVKFVNGFEAGAHHIDESINVLSTFLTSFTDPAAGQSTAQQFLGEGADVIFGAGGQTGSGGIRAAAEAGAWAIGVDQDEYYTTFGGGSAPGADRLATSAIKRVDLGVFTQIAAAITGDFAGGVHELTAENNGITYAPFHDADIPEDVAAQIEEIRAGLADGSIDTGIDPATGEPLDH
ncbi:MAG TPA: BMP family ABC transporter substrate-binding protein [Egibacteraceae bacterium]